METYRKKTLNINKQQYTIRFEVNKDGSAYRMNVLNDSNGKTKDYNFTDETAIDFNKTTGEKLTQMVENQIKFDIENGMI